MSRQDILSKAWTGPQLELRGKPVILSPVRYAVLDHWRNFVFYNDSEQNPLEAIAEIILVCSATNSELRELQKMKPEDRAEKVREFMLDIEDEFDDLSQGIQDRLVAIKSSMTENEKPGKGDAPSPAS